MYRLLADIGNTDIKLCIINSKFKIKKKIIFSSNKIKKKYFIINKIK